jgi:hypothetical protein
VVEAILVFVVLSFLCHQYISHAGACNYAMRLVCTALASVKQKLPATHAQVALQPCALCMRGLTCDEVRKVVEEDFGHGAHCRPLTIHIGNNGAFLLLGQIVHSDFEWNSDLAFLAFCAQT